MNQCRARIDAEHDIFHSNRGARWHRLLIVKLDCTTNVDCQVQVWKAGTFELISTL